MIPPDHPVEPLIAETRVILETETTAGRILERRIGNQGRNQGAVTEFLRFRIRSPPP